MAKSTHYAKGRLAWGICQRCGLRALLNELVFDGYYKNLRVHPECRDGRHPQEYPPVVTDPRTLWKPSPEQGGINPVLTGMVVGLTNRLTWTEADPTGSEMSRIESYVVWRSAGVSDFGIIATLTIVYDEVNFLPPVVTLTYTDSAVTPGVSYRYYVAGVDVYNRELRSNTVSFAADTFFRLLEDGSFRLLESDDRRLLEGAP